MNAFSPNDGNIVKHNVLATKNGYYLVDNAIGNVFGVVHSDHRIRLFHADKKEVVVSHISLQLAERHELDLELLVFDSEIYKEKVENGKVIPLAILTFPKFSGFVGARKSLPMTFTVPKGGSIYLYAGDWNNGNPRGVGFTLAAVEVPVDTIVVS